MGEASELDELRRHPQMPVFLEMLADKRESCVAEVAHCESRCGDDVIAVARGCLELVERVTVLFQPRPKSPETLIGWLASVDTSALRDMVAALPDCKKGQAVRIANAIHYHRAGGFPLLSLMDLPKVSGLGFTGRALLRQAYEARVR